jgi:hypothetical protein
MSGKLPSVLDVLLFVMIEWWGWCYVVLMIVVMRMFHRYKLLHTYDSSIYGNWFDYDDTLDNDDSLVEGTCNQDQAVSGDFTVSYFHRL